MKKVCIIILVQVFVHSVKAQQAAFQGMGAYSTHFHNIFSSITNQASLSRVDQPEAGLCTGRRFLLGELAEHTAILVAPLPGGGMAAIVHFAGSEDFSQASASMAYGRKLGTRADLGIQFNYNRVHIKGYGSAAAMNVELGAIIHLTEQLHTGFHVYNPFRSGYGKTFHESLPSIYSFGMGYEASEQVLLSAGIDKSEQSDATVSISIIYSVLNQFLLKAGIASSPGTYFAAAGVTWKNFRTELSASWHQQLGLSPYLVLVFGFNKDQAASH